MFKYIWVVDMSGIPTELQQQILVEGMNEMCQRCISNSGCIYERNTGKNTYQIRVVDMNKY